LDAARCSIGLGGEVLAQHGPGSKPSGQVKAKKAYAARLTAIADAIPGVSTETAETVGAVGDLGLGLVGSVGGLSKLAKEATDNVAGAADDVAGAADDIVIDGDYPVRMEFNHDK
jgi:hypothetical protein